MKVLLVLLSLSFAASAFGQYHEHMIRTEDSRPLPACETLPTQALTCKLLREARERVSAIPLSLLQSEEVTKRGKKTISRKTVLREFAVTAYDPTTRQWHDIVLSMPLVGNSTFQPVVRTPHDPPYEVTRLKGQTFNKMHFGVRMGERNLYVYAAKHLSIPPAFRNRDVRKMIDETEPIVYLSTPVYVVNEEMARLGKAYVVAALEEVLADLRLKKIASRAFPGKLVGEKVSAEMLMNLLVTEQTDPCLLQERERGCVRLIPALFFKSDDEVMESVLTEFVLNGFQSYRYICSAAAACGAFQFTNNSKTKAVMKNGKKVSEMHLGTYDMVRAAYPGADLDPNFRRGTKSFFNSAKAAALLIDLDLSWSRTPSWVRELITKDQRAGFFLPATSFNAGAVQLRRVADMLLEFVQQKGISVIAFETFPWREFFSWMEAQKKTLPAETFGYLRKSLSYWLHPRVHTSLVPEQRGLQ